MSEENNYENRPYGFPRDLFASVKLYGIRLFSLLFVFGAPILAMQFTGSGKVFPKQQAVEYISFVVLMMLLALRFLILNKVICDIQWDIMRETTSSQVLNLMQMQIK